MRLLLVEDHAVVRAGFRRMLMDVFADLTMGEATCASEAVEAVRKAPWDIIVMDISLPGRSGLEAIADIRPLAPNVPILVMTMYGEDEYAVRAFRTGASGYITKGSAPEELVLAVRKLLAGGRYVSPGLAERLAGGLTVDAEKPLHEALSNREFQVLRMLAGGRTVKEIGHDLNLSHKTVSTYRTRVLEKLHVHGTAELIRYAHRTHLVD